MDCGQQFRVWNFQINSKWKLVSDQILIFYGAQNEAINGMDHFYLVLVVDDTHDATAHTYSEQKKSDYMSFSNNQTFLSYVLMISLDCQNKMADYLINRPFCSDDFIISYEIFLKCTTYVQACILMYLCVNFSNSDSYV